MVIKFNCQYCSRKVRAKDELAGKRVRCPQCGNVVSLPPIKVANASDDPVSVNESSTTRHSATPTSSMERGGELRPTVNLESMGISQPLSPKSKGEREATFSAYNLIMFLMLSELWIGNYLASVLWMLVGFTAIFAVHDGKRFVRLWRSRRFSAASLICSVMAAWAFVAAHFTLAVSFLLFFLGGGIYAIYQLGAAQPSPDAKVVGHWVTRGGTHISDVREGELEFNGLFWLVLLLLPLLFLVTAAAVGFLGSALDKLRKLHSQEDRCFRIVWRQIFATNSLHFFCFEREESSVQSTNNTSLRVHRTLKMLIHDWLAHRKMWIILYLFIFARCAMVLYGAYPRVRELF